MKYVPFVILGIIGIYSHVMGNPLGSYFAGLAAAVWAGVLFDDQQGWRINEYESRLDQLNNSLDYFRSRVSTLQTQLVTTQIEQTKILKNQDVLAGQITDIDRRVQGNDPFGG